VKYSLLIFLIALVISCTKDSRFISEDLINLEATDSFHFKVDSPIQILFLGDLDFGESYQEKYSENILKSKGYLYSFEKMKILLERSDYIIANLETPITPNEPSEVVDPDKGYIHYSDTILTTKALVELNIRAVSLANNHTMDFGEYGLELTERLLKTNQISTFGSGTNEKEAALPLKLRILKDGNAKNLYVFGAFQYYKTYNSKFSFYADKTSAGVNKLNSVRMGKEIELVKQLDSNSMVIVFPHWGRNYQWKHVKQTLITKTLIKSGADIIIGHGSHMIQEIESLSKKPILYSLGNSVFNSKGRYSKFDVFEYSILTILEIVNDNYLLKCYPISSNNLKTNFQPNFVTHREMMDLLAGLIKKTRIPNSMIIEKDEIGFYFKIDPFE
jgi:poly-gamma-glutamate capsule biosynthesis protein CapA/YwtB (metallophosphatase superfamily)